MSIHRPQLLSEAVGGIEGSYRLVAPKKLVALLDGRTPR